MVAAARMTTVKKCQYRENRKQAWEREKGEEKKKKRKEGLPPLDCSLSVAMPADGDAGRDSAEHAHDSYDGFCGKAHGT